MIKDSDLINALGKRTAKEISAIKQDLSYLGKADGVVLRNVYFSATGQRITAADPDDCRIVYFPCDENCKYIVRKEQSNVFRACWTVSVPAAGVDIYDPIQSANGTSLAITTGANAKYLCVYYAYNEQSPDLVLDSVMVKNLDGYDLTARRRLDAIGKEFDSVYANPYNHINDPFFRNGVIQAYSRDIGWFSPFVASSVKQQFAISDDITYGGARTLEMICTNPSNVNVTVRCGITNLSGTSAYIEFSYYVAQDDASTKLKLNIGNRAVFGENMSLTKGWHSYEGKFTFDAASGQMAMIYTVGNAHIYFAPLVIVDYGDPVGAVSNRMNADYISPSLVLPPTIPCVVGKQLMIYYDNAIQNGKISSVARIKADRNNDPGDNMPDKWFWNPSSGDASYTNAFRLYANNPKFQTSEARSLMQVISSSAGSGTTKKCLFIGDSLTQYGGYLAELVNDFSKDSASIELLGTRQSTYADSNGNNRTVNHEGRGGWSAKDYCTVESKNGVSNPFLNNGFNFSHYMANARYSGVDIVGIMLGTNDLSQDTESIVGYFKTIFDSIRAYRSSITILVSLCPPISSKMDNADMKVARLNLAKRLIEEFGGKTGDGIYTVPLYLVVDAENDFPEDGSVFDSTRYAVPMRRISDNTHPTKFGYYKMADMVYYTIKHAMQS